MIDIPVGYRELQPGEIINKDDLLCPKGKQKFVKFKKSLAPGKPYKDVKTPLYPEAIVIRKLIAPNVAIFCTEVGKEPELRKQIINSVQKHIFFSQCIGAFEMSTRGSGRHFYLIFKENQRCMVGFTNDDLPRYGEYKHLNRVNVYELFETLGNPLPRPKPMIIELTLIVEPKA